MHPRGNTASNAGSSTSLITAGLSFNHALVIGSQSIIEELIYTIPICKYHSHCRLFWNNFWLLFLTIPRHGSRRGIVNIMRFEYDFAVRCHRNTVTVSQCQCFIVVQNRVEVFNPYCINWSIKNEPYIFSLDKENFGRKRSILYIRDLFATRLMGLLPC